MKTRRTTVFFGVLTAGLMLTQQACSPVDRPSNNPIAFTAPTEAASATTSKPADPILAGQRKVVIKPIPSFESIVAVDDTGRLGLTDGESAHSLFVLTPVGGKFQIKTAGSNPSCLGIKNNGSASLTVVAATCDTTRAGQLFDISRQKGKAPTYAISSQSAFLQVFPDGLIAEELGDAPLATTYEFVDNGPAN